MNKKSIFLFAITAVFTCVVISGCIKTVGKIPVPVAAAPVGFCDSATYNIKIKKIIDAKCATPACHSAIGAQGGAILTTYAQVSAKSVRIKARALVAGDMPQSPSPPLTEDEKSLIQCWLDKQTPE